jgi:hypothetical protein
MLVTGDHNLCMEQKITTGPNHFGGSGRALQSSTTVRPLKHQWACTKARVQHLMIESQKLKTILILSSI